MSYDVTFTSVEERHIPRIPILAPLSFCVHLYLLSTADSPRSTPQNVALGFSAVMIYCQPIILASCTLEMSNFTPITINTFFSHGDVL